jgi:hypothetical protein
MLGDFSILQLTYGFDFKINWNYIGSNATHKWNQEFGYLKENSIPVLKNGPSFGPVFY